ncbi:MAG: biotin/lipoyl-binding protein, partial [Beijerinckiaceae bacterium]|nr:biotin/lipoyl-binding protein [Beijerinckiaceae bacterium]
MRLRVLWRGGSWALLTQAAASRLHARCTKSGVAALAILAAASTLSTASYAESWWERMMKRQTPAEPSKPAGAAPQEVPGAPAAPTVPVAYPTKETVTEYVELTGNAAAVNTVKLIARVEGYLEQIHFADGAIVKEGDLLFTIQQDQYKAQLVQAEAQ